MKTNLLLAILIISAELLLTTSGFAQTTGEYRSRQSGNWNVPGPNGTWEQWNGSAWVTQNQTGTTQVSPTVQATATGVQNGNVASHPIALPSDIVAGELLLIVFSADGSPTVSVNTSLSGNGWTKLGQTNEGDVVGAIFYKIAQGGDALTLTTNNNESSSHISYRISGGTSLSVYGASDDGGSNASNPPSLSPAPGSAPYLWIATASRDANSVHTGAPTGFSSLVTQASTGGGSTSAATRNFTTNNQNPGNFSGGSSEEWVSYTLAIYSTSPVYTPIGFPQDGEVGNPVLINPVVASTNTSTKTSTGSGAHTVALPSGIEAGDLILIFYSEDDVTGTDPSFSGFTLLYSNEEGSDRYRGAWYKIANGSEGASISAGNYSGRSAHTTYRIAAGTYSGVPVPSTVDLGTDDNPDPPSLTSGFGAVPTMWIASSHSAGDGTVTAPTNYTANLIVAHTGGTGNSHATMGTSYRFTSAASENPGQYDLSDSRVHAAATLAISGANRARATVLNGHNITVTENVTMTQTVINTGGSITVNDGITFANPIGGTFNVNGTLQMGTDGTATVAGAGSFNLNNGGTLGITSSTGITASGAAGNIQTTTRNFNTGANYIYNGSAAQVTGNGLPATISRLAIDNGAGVTLSQATAISNTATFTNGILTTGPGNLLSFNGGAASGGSSDASFVHGPVRKVFNNGTEPQFVFPVGAIGTGDEPITVSGVTAGGASYDFTAEYVRASAMALGTSFSGPILSVSACDYWNLTKNAGKATGITVTLSWDENSGCNGVPFVTSPANLTVAHFNGYAWEQAGGGGTTFSANTVTRTNVTAFSPFSLANTLIGENPLPVVFGNVRAYEKNNGVQIDWSNLTEKDVALYTIERSSNGTDFSAIGEQLPTSNQDDRADYSAFDASPKAGTNYYRIKAEETTGKIVYSKVLSVSPGLTTQSLKLYPNPVKGNQVNISLSNVRSGQYDLRVVNMNGQDVFKQRISSHGSSITQTIDLPSTVAPGVYNMVITGGDYRETKMFIVQ